MEILLDEDVGGGVAGDWIHPCRVVNLGVVHEGLRSEDAQFAPLEDVIHGEGGLANGAAGLHSGQRDILEAGKQTRLHAADAIHKTDVELALAVAVRVHVLGLCLHGVMIAKHAEEPALAGRRYVPVLIRADVHAKQLEARIPMLVAGNRGSGRRSRRRHGCRRRLVHLRFQYGLTILEVGDFLAKLRILIRQILQQARNVIQFVEALQHLRTTIRHAALGRLIHRANGVTRAACAHHAAGFVHHRQHHAAVHPARFIRLCERIFLTRVLGIHFAPRSGGDLRRARAVFHQEVPHRIGARLAQLFVVRSATEHVRVPLNADLISGMILQQFRNAQQTGESVHQDGRVELKIDLLPVVGRRFRIKPLSVHSYRCQRNHRQ